MREGHMPWLGSPCIYLHCLSLTLWPVGHKGSYLCKSLYEQFLEYRFIIMMMRKNKWFLAEATLCVEFALSPHVCMGFLQGLQCPPTSQRCAHEVNSRVYIVSVWMSVGVYVRGPSGDGSSVQGETLPCALSCLSSGHPRPWTRKCQLEYNYLTCLY